MVKNPILGERVGGADQRELAKAQKAERARRWSEAQRCGLSIEGFKLQERERRALERERIDQAIEKWLNDNFNRLWSRYRTKKLDYVDYFNDFDFDPEKLIRRGVPEKVVEVIKAGIERWRTQVQITNSLDSEALENMPMRPKSSYIFFRACGFPVFVLSSPLDFLQNGYTRSSFKDIEEVANTGGCFSPQEAIIDSNPSKIYSGVVRVIIIPDAELLGIDDPSATKTSVLKLYTGTPVAISNPDDQIWIQGSDSWLIRTDSRGYKNSQVTFMLYESNRVNCRHISLVDLHEGNLPTLNNLLGTSSIRIENDKIIIELKPNQSAFLATTQGWSEELLITYFSTPDRARTLKHELFHAFADLYSPVRRVIPSLLDCRLPNFEYDVNKLVNELAKVSSTVAEEVLWRVDDDFDWNQITAVLNDFYFPRKELFFGSELMKLVEEWLEEMGLKWGDQAVRVAFKILLNKMVTCCSDLANLGYSRRQIMLRLIRYPVSDWESVVRRAQLAKEVSERKVSSDSELQ